MDQGRDIPVQVQVQVLIAVVGHDHHTQEYSYALAYLLDLVAVRGPSWMRSEDMPVLEVVPLLDLETSGVDNVLPSAEEAYFHQSHSTVLHVHHLASPCGAEVEVATKAMTEQVSMALSKNAVSAMIAVKMVAVMNWEAVEMTILQVVAYLMEVVDEPEVATRLHALPVQLLETETKKDASRTEPLVIQHAVADSQNHTSLDILGPDMVLDLADLEGDIGVRSGVSLFHSEC